MRNISNIFFDLDHTIWDFDKNCAETLHELYNKYKLHKLGNFSSYHFCETYKSINVEMWKKYNSGKLTKAEIRTKRFSETFRRLGSDPRLVPARLNEDFMHLCPQKKNLIPYAQEVLSYLSGKYTLHIITNGFIET
ncbi:MAG: noncanonical pyrimidine nucleotidase, YjjG family, partial [Cytophagaceae bacterium]